ncbi:MAG: hypothetical protein LUC31_01085 [Coprobacillus sp.]|nr:hypothetical protein [Coprobacillus sp.]
MDIEKNNYRTAFSMGVVAFIVMLGEIISLSLGSLEVAVLISTFFLIIFIIFFIVALVNYKKLPKLAFWTMIGIFVFFLATCISLYCSYVFRPSDATENSVSGISFYVILIQSWTKDFDLGWTNYYYYPFFDVVGGVGGFTITLIGYIKERNRLHGKVTNKEKKTE